MEKSNKLIKISSILYLLIALLVFKFNVLIGGIILTAGIFLLSYSFLPSEELAKKKIPLLIISIITFIFSKVIGTMLFIAFSELQKQDIVIDQNQTPRLSTEAKRIDLLLKIGAAMILISGILFATTTWNAISNGIKCLGLLVLGILFLVLSNYTEKKLNLLKSSKVYFFLGLIFILLTWVGIGSFGVISEWFTYLNEGKNLVYFGTFTILSAILFIINKKYNMTEYSYLAYCCCFLCLYHLLTFIGLDLIITTLIISIVTLIINVFVKCETLSSVSKMLSNLLWIIVITSESGIYVVIASIINLLNMLYLISKSNDNLDNCLGILISYILIINIICNLHFDYINILVFIITSLVYLVVNYNKYNQNKPMLIINQILYNLIISIVLITMIEDSVLLFVFSIVYGLINIITCYIVDKFNKVDLYYQPVIIIIIALSTFNVIGLENNIYTFITIAVIYGLLNYFMKNKKVQTMYYVLLCITTFILALIIGVDKQIIPAIILIILSVYIFTIKKQIWSYIFILFTILILEVAVAEHILPITLTSIMVLLIFVLLTYLIEIPKYRKINLIAIVIPLLSIVNSITSMTEIKTILFNILYLYILFLVIKLFIKKEKNKDIIATIFTSILIIDIIFSRSILIGVYIGILSLIIIFITYNKKYYKGLFYCGVVSTILNILVQLSAYWSINQLWIYLLVGGIALIAFVTYREIKRQNIKESNDIEVYNFCDVCGTKNNGGKYCIKCGKCLIKPKEN